MSRKSPSGSGNGFGDIIGVALLAAALLLIVAQLSFDRNDISFLTTRLNKPTHNLIGPLGAYLAWGSFLPLGLVGYLAPVLLAAFGVAYLLNFFGYLREHLRWSLLWSAMLLISLTGLLHILDKLEWLAKWRENIGSPFAGGWLGFITYGQTSHHDYGFCLLGRFGAVVVYSTLCFISLLLLTNFRLGEWIRSFFQKAPAGIEPQSADEIALERRARELEKEAKKLQEEVASTLRPDKIGTAEDGRSGLGADLQPVPEPTVRDLSVPQAKPVPARPHKTTPAGPAKESEPASPAGPVETTPTREAAAATLEEVPGKKPEAGEKPEPQVHIAPVSAAKPRAKKPKPLAVAATPIIGNYQLPPLDLLQYPDTTVKPTESKEALLANARLMQQTLAQFEIPVELGDITKGPTITRYEFHPAPGVKLEKITALSNNIAAAVKAERVHILAPVPGKSSVGIEVPNPVTSQVIVRDMFESEEWRSSKAKIPIGLGKDVYGHPIVADLDEMPHLLIAGSTGSGKSVCLNAIITSLLYRFSPDQLRFVMIDPKVVELQHYNTLPHLVVPVITDPKKVILALRWVINEVEKRYQIFAKVGVRNINSFNSRPKNKPLPEPEPELPLKSKKEKVEPGAEGFAVEVDEEIVVPREDDIVIPEKLSYIVVIIDELADLMLVAPADVEMAIARITQMARAAGIHCIVATQRPSVDVITGVIKANITARIAFQCASKVDSRTILDVMGAEKLLGKGDMLYLPPGSAKLIRAQGALITDPEITSIVGFIARQAKPSYEMEIHQQLFQPLGSAEDESGIDEDEELIQQCIAVIRSEQKASVSLLQRRLRLGYTRAARIMDELENRGIVGPSKGAEPRDILIDLDGGGADGRGQQAV
jgi:S-DNA-T family DNA segregation ATPase FtsK/SpoIIIE